MSGIVGAVNFNGEAVSPEQLEKMAKTIAHRGPDNEGVHVEGNVGLSHRLLKLSTIEEEIQPLSNEKKDLWIVSDSEIYGTENKSSAKTILNFYEKYGIKCVKYLEGVFSFVIFDRQKQILFCAVDHFSVKPFVYYIDKEKFLFASEAKALFEYDGIEKRVNSRILVKYMKDDSVHDEETLFEGVKRLFPAHYMILDLKKKKIKKVQYWDLDPKKKRLNITFEECVIKFEKLFEESIRKRIRGMNTVGGTTSGGMDSSSVVCTIDKVIKESPDHKNTKLFLFSIVEELVNEKEFAEKIVEKRHSEMEYIKPEPCPWFKQISQILWFEEEPVLISTLYKWPMTKLAHEKKAQVLSFGTAGDEIFAGYYKHFYRSFADLFVQFKWGQLYKEISGITKPLKDKQRIGNLKRLGYPGSQIPVLAKPIIFLRTLAIIFPMLQNLPFFFPETKAEKDAPIHRYLSEEFMQKFREERCRLTENKYPGYLDNKLYNHFLVLSPEVRVVERVTMAFSIIPIFPIVDKNLIEFMFSIPSEYKMKGAMNKAILRAAMKGIVPDEILLRKEKQGFGSYSNLFCINNKEEIRDILMSESFRRRGMFNYEKIMQDFESLITGNSQLGGDWLLRIVCLELWHRIFIDKEEKNIEVGNQ